MSAREWADERAALDELEAEQERSRPTSRTAAGPGLDAAGWEDAGSGTLVEAPPRSHARARRPRCEHVLDARAVCTLCGLGLDVAGLADAIAVAAEGRRIAETGVPWVVQGIVPAYGMLGMLVAYAKVGKTTFAQSLGAAVSGGKPFLGRRTTQARVLVIAAEDPPEYTAYVARHLAVEPGAMTFFRQSVILNDLGLAAVTATVKAGGYGLVLVSSWQAVVRGLVRDENDNAGAVVVVESVKAATRETRVPWLIDAHSGKAENQEDEADPARAQRGASAAAAAADYTLWLRYADGAFSFRRRLSGKGRFVTLAPQMLAYDADTGTYECLGATKDAARETTWRQIVETGALTAEPRSVDAIARAAGLVTSAGKVAGHVRRRLNETLRGREGITRTEGTYCGRKTVLYSLGQGEGQ